jgi:hypothetical protein
VGLRVHGVEASRTGEWMGRGQMTDGV